MYHYFTTVSPFCFILSLHCLGNGNPKGYTCRIWVQHLLDEPEGYISGRTFRVLEVSLWIDCIVPNSLGQISNKQIYIDKSQNANNKIINPWIEIKSVYTSLWWPKMRQSPTLHLKSSKKVLEKAMAGDLAQPLSECQVTSVPFWKNFPQNYDRGF